MLSILYNIIISPIELVVEVVFELLFRLVGRHETNQGLAVIGVSVAISFLTLPLYRRADAVQQKERDTQRRLSHWVNHIKRHFTGDERFMMLQAYYRENGYNPLQSLKGSISLLLEIPFFIAAYHFLSHLEVLRGASFGPIADLGAPDALIRIGGLRLNLLPVLMTAVNCASAAVYLRGLPLRDKIQAYGMALVFLVLLYGSPAGLVVYWTCNNVFSLVKNVFYRLKNPRGAVAVACALAGVLLTAALALSGSLNSRKKMLAVLLLLCAALVPLFVRVSGAAARTYARKLPSLLPEGKAEDGRGAATFLLPGTFLTLLLGVLIPSAVIAASPAEFIDLQDYQSPLHFLVNSTCYAAGFFLVWAPIIHSMLRQGSRRAVDLLLWVLSGVFLVDYMCFGRNPGLLSPLLSFEDFKDFSRGVKLLNLAVVAAALPVLTALFRHRKLVVSASAVLAISAGALSAMNIQRTRALMGGMSFMQGIEIPPGPEKLLSLSRTGRNVIVFMLDRAIGGYVPYLMEERPGLKEQFAGFTYYPNTLSHGFFTNFGTPALFGGYEYTVTEMNRRSTESLAAKQNEALKVLPVIFSRAGFDVTVCDPPYAGYTWVPDLSVFDEYPEIKKYITSGTILNDALLNDVLAGRSGSGPLEADERNFFCYGVLRAMPLIFSKILYDGGHYFSTASFYADSVRRMGFFREYSVLSLLPDLTRISDGDRDCYLSVVNSTTHEPMMLQLPDYELVANPDNSGLTMAGEGHIRLDNERQIIHYHANMAALMALGRWFDFMRENGVYDNTRIIIVADHGRGLAQFDHMLMREPEIDVEWCNPLLMVKDFGATELTMSHEFMTNADVPTLATDGVIEGPTNPFTGKRIDDAEKRAHPQLVTSSRHYDITKNNGTTFDTSDGHWFSVHDDIFAEENWEQLD